MVESSSDSAPQPHPLRGHHFGTLLKAYGSFGAAGTARDLILTMQEYRRGATSDEVDLALLDAPGLPQEENHWTAWEQAYSVDMIGDTPAQAAQVQQGTEKAISRFQQLDEDYPVKIGVGIMDDQCNSCIFQRHCQNMSEASLRPDYNALTTVQSVIEHLGLAARSVVSGVEGDLQSWELVTDAATLRSVVGYFQDLNADDPQIPFENAAYNPAFHLFERPSE